MQYKVFVIWITEMFHVLLAKIKSNLKVSRFNTSPFQPAYLKIHFKIISLKIITHTIFLHLELI